MDYKNILVLTDFSPCADEALRTAVKLQKLFGASMTVLHVAHDESHLQVFVDDDKMEIIKKNIDNEIEKGFQELEQKIEGLKDLDWVSKVRYGVPYIEALDEAESEGYDLIMIGSHGHTGLTKFLYGSTAEKVLRDSPISVHVVKSGECE